MSPPPGGGTTDSSVWMASSWPAGPYLFLCLWVLIASESEHHFLRVEGGSWLENHEPPALIDGSKGQLFFTGRIKINASWLKSTSLRGNETSWGARNKLIKQEQWVIKGLLSDFGLRVWLGFLTFQNHCEVLKPSCCLPSLWVGRNRALSLSQYRIKI